MAEARSAVELGTLKAGHRRRSSTGRNFEVTRDDIKSSIYDRPKTKTEAFWRGCIALQHGAKRWYARTGNAVRKLLFPSTPLSLYVSCGAVLGLRLYPVFGSAVQSFMLNLDQHLPYIRVMQETHIQHVASSLAVGTGTWLVGAYVSQLVLKALLRYKGYMYDGRGGPSISTRLWSVSVWLFAGLGKPLLHSYDNVLPCLPVPRLRDTLSRYLESMEPILDEVEFERLQRLAADFGQTQGYWLQILLVLKSWWAVNYVSDWWERFVYLRWRDPAMINSNYYIMDARDWRPTNHPIPRAANLIYQMMRFSTMIQHEQLPPLLLQGQVPLCMRQYRRLFGTTRIAEIDEDRLQTVPSKYVVVLCMGHFFVMDVFDRKQKRLTPRDLEEQLTKIHKRAHELPSAGLMGQLPVMTGGDRDAWAEIRSMLMQDFISAASLEKIERAAFVVVLDEEARENAPSDASEPCPVANALIHGSGANRWFDKSFNFVVFANGKCGLNVEHSWADAPVTAHMFEWALAEEFLGPGYDNVTGRNKAIPQPKHDLKEPALLKWGEVPHDVLAAIEDGMQRAEEQIEDLDLRIFKHDAYSKGFIKRQKISPDAYVQMALQLAYYRERGEFCQTYEASMTRLFRAGRTETVRPVSMDSKAFVLSMSDPNATDEDREALLRKAVATHVDRYRMAMCGQGVDRHLFALYVAAIGAYGQDNVHEFLGQVKAVPWALSTSQTPGQQTTHWDLKANPNKVTGGGGFGPVSDDGYGVSYIIATDDVLMLHVSSKQSSKLTNSHGFCNMLVNALSDMRELLERNAAKRRNERGAGTG